ncbi:DUF945 family protein [Bordetella avium]|uniref:Exported protein n=1 Tax=Bordetella avium (strain 197N) TaxID=360910 RepID=Q2KYL1_BORA1|nr:DUF945 family protein [Bordetella avium]RIQ16811.1 DUF945 family protein [Bordetella avium]RIQ35145.1 DUF945 family protein [Bordetella avium]RIQ49492.1 DUF945 family protein [Bordetella avium]RIQ54322.1 DUF945 family protein [Bordetella avium]RIQ63286.1 DUF945 family protein [Bordetella avium]
MKKRVAITSGVVIVGVGAWLGATWYTGKRIEEQTHQYLAQANEKLANVLPGLTIRLEQDRYDRGFFSSQARYTLSFTADKDDETPLAISFKSDIAHGPFPGGAIKRGKFLPQLAFVHSELESNEQIKPLFDMAQGKTPLWSNAIISYDGVVDDQAGIAALSLNKDGGAIDFSGAAINTVYDYRTQAVKGRLQADQLLVDVPKGDTPSKASLNGLSLDIDTHLGKFGVSVGNSGLLIKRLELQTPNIDQKLLIENLGYAVVVSEDDKFVGGKAVYKVDKVGLADTDLGGGELALSVSHLDGPALKSLSATYKQMMHSLMGAGQADEGQQDEQVASVIENATKLLAANPSLGIDQLVWRNTAGESRFNLALDLTLPPGKDLAALDLSEGASQLVQQLVKSIAAELKVSKPMAALLAQQVLTLRGASPEQAKREADETIQGLAGMAEMMALGRNDGDNIISKFNYADGRGELNGKEVPVKEWLAELGNSLGGDDVEEAEETIIFDTLEADMIGALLDEAGYDYDYDAATRRFTIDPDGMTPTAISATLICAPDCTTLRMQAVYDDLPVPSPADITRWNEEYQTFGRASINKRGKVVLQNDVDVSDGLSLDVLQIYLLTFLAISDDFPEIEE